MTSFITRILPLLLLALRALGYPAARAADAGPAWVKQVEAKNIPSAKMPSIAAKCGAVGDGKTRNTQVLQKANDAAAKKGGIVTLASGQYLTGSLCSSLAGMTLDNATITAERAEGLNYAKGYIAKNVTITAKDDEPIAVQNSSKIKF